ncbi:DUF3772 domain-containing protein [Roseovarius sp. Pro17]|uniref:DUF3772 domain-containing protein n=1 Tax=Roseovarius sp. Pro17 TaxID=3108175 RepID=UPI002D7944B2|nr:DUF3772 domain-containing protein [Roseovarius sp. Pro17]
MSLLRNVLLALSLALLPIAACLTLAPSAAEAQQPPSAPDYERWDVVAKRATDAIAAQRASTSAFESLREQLAEWRDVFVGAQNINSNAIATLEAQLRALGPAPTDGESEEAPGIINQRKSLNDQLAKLREPVKEAELAYSKADEMIKSVDRIVRERQTEELLERGPSPLNPVNWSEGASALSSSFQRVRGEVADKIAGEAGRADLIKRLPVAVLLALVGMVLLLRGRFWAEFLVRIVRPQAATSARWLISFLISLGEVIVPFIGFMILIKALELGGIVGTHGAALLNILKSSLLIFLCARWLAMRCFPRRSEDRLPLALEPDDRRAGRLYGGALGLIIGVFHFVYNVGNNSGWSAEARVVVLFPITVAASLLLVRVSRLLSKHSMASGLGDQDEASEETYRSWLARLLSKLLIAIAVVAPILAAFGYNKASSGLLMPSLLSLMMLAALLILQGLIVEIYILASRGRDGAGEDLLPMLLGFIMVLASVPVFALIWGARVADLSELWVSFRRGVTLGEMTISPSVFITFAIVFAVGFAVTRLLQGTLRTSLLPKTKIDTGGRDAIVSGVGYVGIFLAALIGVTSAGIDLSSLAIVAGALSVGIGFGLQNIVSNFVSGIILLIERPISQGDWIEVNGQHGTVREISVRSTRIETFDRSDLIIPNADLVSGTVTNYTKGSTVGRLIVNVGVAYGTDTKWVEDILREIASAHPMVLMNPAPTIIFKGIGTDSFNFEIRAILRDVNWIMNVLSDMNHEIAARFAKEGIEMPYQQRDIWLRNPETLSGALGGAAKREESQQASQTLQPDQAEGRPKGDPQRVESGDGGEGAGGADR